MRTVLLAICLIFVSVNLYSQSNDELAKYDSLYAKGVDAYNQQDFAEAIRLTTEALNIQEGILGKDNAKYAEILNILAKYNSAIGNYSEAISLATEAKTIKERVLGKEHPSYATSLNNLASYYSSIGNYHEAIKLGTEALNIKERILGIEDSSYAISLMNLAGYHSHNDNYAEAIRLTTDALVILKEIGTEHSRYAICLNNLASYNSLMDNNEEAIRLGTEALNIQEKVLGKDHPSYVTSLNNLAKYYSCVNNYVEAIRLCTDAINIIERWESKNHPIYAGCLNNLAHYNRSLGNFNEAIKFDTEALRVIELIFGKEHPDYVNSLNNLAANYYNIGNYSEAIYLELESLSIINKIVGKGHSAYATCLNNLAKCYSAIGNYSESLRFGTEAMTCIRRIVGEQHSAYAGSLSNLSTYNYYLGNYETAISLENEALNIRQCIFGKEHLDVASSLNNISVYERRLGNYSQAIHLAKDALNIKEKILGRVHSDYATTLDNIAMDYSSIGNFDEAIRLGREVLDIRQQVFGKDHPDYTTSLNNLAGYFALEGNYENALQTGEEAKQLRERVFGKDHPYYATSLNNLAGYFALEGNYEKALQMGQEAMTIRERVIGSNHPDYATTLHNLAWCHSSMGNYAEAIRLGTEAKDIRERVLGKDHPDWITVTISLSKYYFYNNDLENAELSAIDVNSSYRDYLRKTFASLTSAERRMFWDKEKYWFEDVINKYAHYINSPQLAADAYNMTLLAKGILLNSERDFSTLITESGDEDAIKTFDNLRMTRLQLNRFYEKPIAERFMDVDSLERVAQQLERELLERSKVYGDFTRNMAIDWNDVSQKLGPKDVAIEFVSFPAKNDSVIYAAYVLDPKMKNPEMVALFDERELSRIPVEDYYNKAELSRLVWGKLDSYINTAENIFFAPAGELYNIAIESLPDYERDGQLADHHNLYRLSSTRQLAVIKDKNPLEKVALYGGLKYDTDVKVLEKDADKYPSTVERSFSLINLPDSLNLRSGVWDLPATKIEVENINLSFNRKSVTSSVYTDTLGTEASFKALSGKRTNIIHIATHGFYWTDKEVRRMSNPGFIFSNDLQGARYVEDKALTRTGLLFAGANNVLCGKPLPDNVQDGILTAQEISALDLIGLDMIVMSACQTGLGDVTGDGVFGLQRGFKKAGANSLLMSLWKVDDRATQMLMTKFYDYYLSGKKKLESLTLAQKYLREYEEDIDDTECQELTASQQRKEKRQGADVGNSPVERIKTRPFANPKYWAAFILLDALD